jgi:hypothetical protein
MATSIKKISPKIIQWTEYMGYDIEKIKQNVSHVKTDQHCTFGIEKLSRSEAIEEGCDLNFPYRLFNPYNYDVK